MFRPVGPLWAQATAGDNAFARLVKVGKKVLRKVFHKDVGPIKGTELPKPTWSLSAKTVQLPEQSATRRLIGGLFPKQAWHSQASEFRRQAALRLITNSRKVPVFAFVGLSLGASLEKKSGNADDVLCSGIRGLFQQYEPKSSQVTVEDQQFSLQSLELGKLIGKGCNAAVYEARPATLNDAGETEEVFPEAEVPAEDTETVPPAVEVAPENSSADTREESPSAPNSNTTHPAVDLDEDDDFTVIDEEPDNSSDNDLSGWVLYRVSAPRTSTPEPDFSDTDSDIFILATDEESLEPIPESLDNDPDVSWQFENGPESSQTTDSIAGVTSDSGSSERMDEGASSYLSSGSSQDKDMRSAATSEAASDLEPAPNISLSGEDCPLAVKMMFNYSVESKADRIMSAMAKEMVPAQSRLNEHSLGHTSPYNQKKHLPPHPNIVTMYGAFVDETPRMPGDSEEYPSALPSRLHSEGLGRNSTLFLVMKKYTMTLREFLAGCDVPMATRCRLFAQLLEGVTHLGDHGISHRDLKSDNILIDLTNGKDQPLLAISDFGCCLADTTHGLQIPYNTGELDKGGNCALMAPEIKCAEPGPWAVLDYVSADLWAAGALAYEIFGMENPFYGHYDARYYSEEELPQLPADVPETVQRLVRLMLRRDPYLRPTPAQAATVLQLYLWAPERLQPLRQQDHDKSHQLWQYKELCDWLEQLAVEAVCQRVFRSNGPQVDFLLKQLFLSRVTRNDVLAAVSFE